MDVAVVGAGIHGLSASRQLAEHGHRVVLFDPRPVGHPFGSSHGPNRIVRRAYPDAYHTALMTEAYPLWRELEAASQTKLFHEVGLLCFGPAEGEYVAGTAAALESQSVPFARLTQPEAEAKMPGLRLNKGEAAVFVPEAGWVAAEQAIQATYRLALAAGVEHFTTPTENLDPFDRVIICPGPWVRDFWPEAPITVTLQATAHLVIEMNGPVWIEEGPDLLYGFPTFGPGAKIGVHRPGAETNPNDPKRQPPAAMLDAIRNFGTRRFGLENPELTAATGCLYTVTPDEGFLFHPLDDRKLLISACSGHGFKFGPWIGVQATRWAEDRLPGS